MALLAEQENVQFQDSNLAQNRSEAAKPDGIDSLAGLDKFKVEVEMANQLYAAVFYITECAVELGICVRIENPTNSHYWNVEPTMKIRTKYGDRFVTFHACAHGGTIWNSQHYFNSLELRCDGKHSHATWQLKRRRTRFCYVRGLLRAWLLRFCSWVRSTFRIPKL